MYPDWSGPLALGLVLVWLGTVSFYVWRQNNFLKSLFPKSGERDIRKKFEELTQATESYKVELAGLDKKLAVVIDQGLKHIQKVEILRFNPYDETGGDQSFVVCLLDNKGTGLVITSLHARNGTRVFGKEIVLGKSSKYELSKEEELVIKKALTKN